MINLKQDIASLTDFKRKTTECLEHLRESGRPMVLTVNGHAQVVVQDAEAYQALLDRVEAIEGIREGLLDVRQGRTQPARQVLRNIRNRAQA